MKACQFKICCHSSGRQIAAWVVLSFVLLFQIGLSAGLGFWEFGSPDVHHARRRLDRLGVTTPSVTKQLTGGSWKPRGFLEQPDPSATFPPIASPTPVLTPTFTVTSSVSPSATITATLTETPSPTDTVAASPTKTATSESRRAPTSTRTLPLPTAPPPRPTPTLTAAEFYPVADAYIAEGAKSTNFGQSSALYVGRDLLQNKGTTRSFIKFDIRHLKEVKIDHAEFILYLRFATQDAANPDMQVDLRVAREDWDERTIAWDNQPALHLDNLESVLVGCDLSQAVYFGKVTNAVQEWLNSDNNFGFALVSNNQWFVRSFYSKEHTNQDLRPKLVVYYRPMLPILELTLQSYPNPFQSLKTGDIISYGISYKNVSKQYPIDNVIIVGMIPRGTDLVEKSFWPAHKIPNIVSNELQWHIGDISPGTTGSLGYRVRVRQESAGAEMPSLTYVNLVRALSIQDNNTYLISQGIVMNNISVIRYFPQISNSH